MAKTEKVVLHNTSKEFKRELFAADGDSMHIMPDCKQPVDRKFLWNLPQDVVEFKNYETTFGIKTTTKNVTKRTENTKNPEDTRSTVKVN